MKIRVEYTDETIETYNTLQEAEEGVKETVAGCDFAATVNDISIVDEKGTPIGQLQCDWSVRINLDKQDEKSEQLGFCSRCTKPIVDGNEGRWGGWCEECKKAYA